jgi:hypothetical protein
MRKNSMDNVLKFERQVDLDVYACDLCENDTFYLAMNKEVYCSECRRQACVITDIKEADE